MDNIRKPFKGKTGRVLNRSYVLFTTDDKEWHRIPNGIKLPFYDVEYRIKFPTGETIVFTEEHLKLFEV